MKKSILFVLVAFAAIVLSGCSGKIDLVMVSYDKRKPLTLDDKLQIAFSNVIPVAPENGVLIATIKTDPEVVCSGEAAMNFLIKTSRELGANFLFVKKAEEAKVVVGAGVYYRIKQCTTLYADFMEVKEEK